MKILCGNKTQFQILLFLFLSFLLFNCFFFVVVFITPRWKDLYEKLWDIHLNSVERAILSGAEFDLRAL